MTFNAIGVSLEQRLQKHDFFSSADSKTALVYVFSEVGVGGPCVHIPCIAPESRGCDRQHEPSILEPEYRLN